MNKMMFALILILWLALLVSTGDCQNKIHSTRLGKQAFVYVLTGQDVRLYKVKSDGTLKVIYQNYVRIGQFPRCIMATPNGRTLYVSSDADTNDYHSGVIFEFKINKNGSLEVLGGIEAGYLPLVMTMDSSGSFLYCSAQDAIKQQGLIYQYRIEKNGMLSALKPAFFNLGKVFAGTLVVTSSKKYLYAVTVGRPICFRISRNGALVRLPTPPTQANVEAIALSPSGKYAYCLQSGGVISVAAIEQNTGSFSPLRPVAHVPSASYSLLSNPQRNTLQITNAHIIGKNTLVDGPISEFHILPNGDLKPTVPPTFSRFMAYRRLAPNPSAGFVNVIRSQ